MKRASGAPMTFRDIVTRSPEMARVIRLGERAAASGIPILIEGESGVGKELVARAIQGDSERRNKPFVTVNCGATRDPCREHAVRPRARRLHRRGGAPRRKVPGGPRGTLFLTRSANCPLDVQVKLLRAIRTARSRRSVAGAPCGSTSA